MQPNSPKLPNTPNHSKKLYSTTGKAVEVCAVSMWIKCAYKRTQTPVQASDRVRCGTCCSAPEFTDYWYLFDEPTACAILLYNLVTQAGLGTAHVIAIAETSSTSSINSCKSPYMCYSFV